MTKEEIAEQLLNEADILITHAEELFAAGKSEEAAEKLREAVDTLSRAGIDLTANIPRETLEKCESLPMKIIHKIAEDSELIPDPVPLITSQVPDIEVSLPDKKISPSNLPVALTTVFESEPKNEPNPSALEKILELLTGQHTIKEFIFNDNGLYTTVAETIAPYIIAGATYISRDEEKAAGYEESIPEMLNGPVRHLVELLFSLLTSALFAGIILLLVKRFLLHSKGNVAFATGMASLLAANFPLIIQGLKAASSELRDLKNIAFA